eukprot:1159079-Pelagomonas_calceolata.AAC.1
MCAAQPVRTHANGVVDMIRLAVAAHVLDSISVIISAVMCAAQPERTHDNGVVSMIRLAVAAHVLDQIKGGHLGPATIPLRHLTCFH